MSAAYDFEDLHHLVDRLSPEQAQRLRLLVRQDDELSRVADAAEPGDGGASAGLLALIGVFDGPTDLAERHDHYVAERMRNRLSDPE